jgi:hypothetical protein
MTRIALESRAISPPVLNFQDEAPDDPIPPKQDAQGSIQHHFPRDEEAPVAQQARLLHWLKDLIPHVDSPSFHSPSRNPIVSQKGEFPEIANFAGRQREDAYRTILGTPSTEFYRRPHVEQISWEMKL